MPVCGRVICKFKRLAGGCFVVGDSFSSKLSVKTGYGFIKSLLSIAV